MKAIQITNPWTDAKFDLNLDESIVLIRLSQLLTDDQKYDLEHIAVANDIEWLGKIEEVLGTEEASNTFQLYYFA